MSEIPDVVVLRKGTEGLSVESYAEELREHLPGRPVELARTPAEERELVRDARVVTGVDIDEEAIHAALARTDYLVVACPLTDATRGLVGEAELTTLPPHAVVVNVARGPIVDTDALVAALETGSIRGAALDVTDPEPLPADHPLSRLENGFVTSHTGGHNPEHWPRLAEVVATNLAQLDDPEELENVVLAPGDEP
jgi:phosphoglycerate dehydrogenase-like enzyme